MLAITAADTAYARRNNDRRRGYAEAWHSAWRAAGRALGVERIPANVPASILALAEQLATLLGGDHSVARWVGFDEAFVLYVDGARRLDLRSSLPSHAGLRSSSLSLAIELVAALEPGQHTIALGSQPYPPRSDRSVSVEVAA